jgi:hypothetical protein
MPAIPRDMKRDMERDLPAHPFASLRITSL